MNRWKNVVIFTVLGLFLFGIAGCSIPGLTSKQEAQQQKVEKELQQKVSEALSDPSKTSRATGAVKARYKVGQEFPVDFTIAEWISENGVTKPVYREGKARIKVNNWQMQFQAGKDAPQNGAFLVVTLTITADSANSARNSGAMVTPRDFGAIGTEIPPRFSVVDAKGQQYKYDSWHTRAFNVSESFSSSVPRDLSDIRIDEREPKTINIAFDVPQNISQPRLWVECTRLNKTKDVFEVMLE